jgi:tRNA nucleotidyltransferase (CCA-adding enzyme)
MTDGGSPQLQHRLQTYLPDSLRQLLQDLAARASQRGWPLYLVGGAVRDLWLAPHPDRYRPKEFDLVVEGTDSLAEGGAVALAQAWQADHPQVQLQVYGQFQTAALRWGTNSDLPGFSVDIATARTEFYPYPAAHPEVSASSIRQDLYRRDFSINALAIRLTSNLIPSGSSQACLGELLDFFGGIADLKQQQIRVLHPNSFIEDPTRIFRAVRFAVRLGFKLESQTEAYIRHAMASGVYSALTQEQRKLPSLQSRLRNELKYLLQAEYWQPAFQLLGDLGALQCLHPQLVPSPELWRRMRLAACWLQQVEPHPDGSWQIMLEVLIASLPASCRSSVAIQLNLTDDSQRRLQQLATSQDKIHTQLVALGSPSSSQRPSPSQVVACLQKVELPLLILVASQSRAPVRRLLWRYLTHWRRLKPLLNGDQLRQLGYRPGPQFRQILDRVLAATLDGELTDQDAALAFVLAQFPLILAQSHGS